MKRILLFPHKFGSGGAKLLANALSTKRIRDVGRYHKRSGDFIINWGNTRVASFGEANLNVASAVSNSVDKVKAFSLMKEAGVSTVEFVSDKQSANQWLQEGHTVYARLLTRASGGRGIQILNPRDTVIPNARLYTKGVTGDEYRLHVFNGEVIDYTKKVPLSSGGQHTHAQGFLIKNHENGWTFARNVQRRPSLETLAVKAVKALGLDFGAVDIIMVEGSKGKNTWPRVLEINSACGITGRTVGVYAEAIKKFVNNN